MKWELFCATVFFIMFGTGRMMSKANKRRLLATRGTLKERRQRRESRVEVGPMTRKKLWGIGEELRRHEVRTTINVITRACGLGNGDIPL